MLPKILIPPFQLPLWYIWGWTLLFSLWIFVQGNSFLKENDFSLRNIIGRSLTWKKPFLLWAVLLSRFSSLMETLQYPHLVVAVLLLNSFLNKNCSAILNLNLKRAFNLKYIRVYPFLLKICLLRCGLVVALNITSS